MKTKLLLLLLSLSMIAGIFSGCKQEEDQQTTDTTPPDVQGTILDTLPEANLGGREFTIFGQAVEDLVFHEMQSENLDQISYQRTAYLEEKYNVFMNAIANDRPYDVLSNDSMSGGGTFDIVKSHPTEGIAALMTGGYCTNLLSLNNLSLSKEWYNQSAVESYTTNDKLYLTEININYGGTLTGFVYNRDLYQQAGFTTDLYQTVYDGDWKLETFYSTVMAYSPSMDGVADNEKSYSLVYHTGLERSFMYGIGEKTVRRNSENEYELALSPQKLNMAADMLYKLVYESENVYVGEQTYYDGWGTSDMMSIFKSGRAMFIEYDIGGLYTYLRDIEFDIGYLPMPQYDVYQTEYMSNTGGCTWFIPTTISTPEESAVVMEAITRYGHVYLRPAFYDEILAGRLSKKDIDVKMLDLLFDSLVYDIGFTFDGAGAGPLKGVLTYVVIGKKTNTVDSFMESQELIYNAIVNQINNIE